MSTISTKISHGITIGASGSNTYPSPLTITSSGGVSISGTGDAVYSSMANATLDNAGSIVASGTTAAGVGLIAGGYVDNSGLISNANWQGIKLGTSVNGSTAGTVTNSGTIAGVIGVQIFGDGATVTNDTGGLIQVSSPAPYDSAYGIKLGGPSNIGNNTVENSGTIIVSGSDAGLSSDAIYISGGGLVENRAGGLIKGSVGVIIAHGTGTLVNSGTISGIPVATDLQGSTTNNAGAVIQGVSIGVALYAAPRTNTLTNFGTIEGTGTKGIGILLGGGSLITNSAGAVVSGAYAGVFADYNYGSVQLTNIGTIVATGAQGVGVDLPVFSGATVADSGTITGSSGTAIRFGEIRGNLLVLEQGYALFGGVVGSARASNTLELAGTVGAAVTVDYNGLRLTNFQHTRFGAGGYDAFKISNTSGTLPVTISGFAQKSELIDLTAIGTDGTIANFDTITDRLTVSGSLGTVALQLDNSDARSFTTASDGSSGTDINPVVPCFCRGTLIMTDRGAVAVEDLTAGDRAITLSGVARTIQWIGFGRTLVTPRNRCDVSPVIVRRGALADDRPHRDLTLTRRHALLVGEVLVPVEHLINGVSVVWDNVSRVIEYYHVELDTHDVLLANGAPTESFRDDDSRDLFQNEHRRPPRAAPKPPCRPIINRGPLLELAWRNVASRVGKPPAHWLTEDSGLHMVVDGRRVEPTFASGGMVRFHIDRPKREVCIVSRSCIPDAHGSGRDLRRLGVGIVALTLFCPAGRRVLPLWADELTAGFHECEGDIRWTKGLATLSTALFKGTSERAELEMRIAGDLLYPREMAAA